MPISNPIARRNVRNRYKKCPIDCPIYLDTNIATLADFFAVFHSLLEPNKMFWFRGHPKLDYELTPSALRHDDPAKRELALDLVTDMKRYLEFKLTRPPASDDTLGWIQVAQHYGLPTRLLDWTQNAAAALFFACNKDIKSNGLVAILNPIELNLKVDRSTPRIFNQQNDSNIIEPYLSLNGRIIKKNGRHTIAINPTWNTERIAIQQGVFTLHGSRKLDIDRKQASSLLYVPILHEHKESLLGELERVGIGEMFIFPEPEHVCAHLRRNAKL